MLHLIAYDIASDRRLRRIASLCEDYGTRIEKSVFECDLDDETFLRFWQRLEAMLEPDCDAVVDYPISRADRVRIRTLGRCIRPKEGPVVF